MNTSWGSVSQNELLIELERTEWEIAHSHTFQLCADAAGTVCERVSAKLLALAEREHLIVNELRARQGARRAAEQRPAAAA